MKLAKISVLYIVILFLNLSSLSFAFSTTGRFDYYVLALSWQPGFCETKPQKPECISQTRDRFDATHFSLHGLWPNVRGDNTHGYDYCGVSKDIYKKDKKRKWCRLPKLELSDSIIRELQVYMPGFGTCLQRHEWYKHGACTGLTANEYFKLSLSLVRELSESSFNRFISESVGSYLQRNSILRAFDDAFGQGASSFLELKCKSVKGEKLLTEIRIYLRKDLDTSKLLKDLFPEKRYNLSGRCPKRIKIDKAGLGN